MPDGSLETNQHWNLSVGYTHLIFNKLTTNLNYASLLMQENSRPNDAMRSGYIAHANVMYKISNPMLTGIEYMWGERENVSGAKGIASRVQTTVQYFF